MIENRLPLVMTDEDIEVIEAAVEKVEDYMGRRLDDRERDIIVVAVLNDRQRPLAAYIEPPTTAIH